LAAVVLAKAVFLLLPTAACFKVPELFCGEVGLLIDDIIPKNKP
jgi:hypothetical protein